MQKYTDLTNQKIGRLKVVKLSNQKDSNHTTRLWECLCDCGNITYKSARILNEAKKNAKMINCGCANFNNLIGKKFGDITVKKYLYSKNQKRFWECECICGDVFVFNTEHFSKSRCLCTKKQAERVQYLRRLRHIYQRMKSRCYNEKDKSYWDYGGRGIKICKSWLDNINNFINWSLKHGYSPNLQIDRINNNDDYRPMNCRWADAYTQAGNKRNNLNISYNGKTQCLRKWCRELNLPYRKTHKRIVLYNWDIDKCFAEKERVGF